MTVRDRWIQQFFAPDGGTGTEGGDPPGGDGDPQPPDGPKFTQADIDRVVKERLARETSKAQKTAERLAEEKAAEALRQFREEHGFDDEALEQWKQRDQSAAQTRALKAAATKAENERKKLEEAHTRALAKLDRTLCENALIKALTDAKCTDVELALAKLRDKVKLKELDGEYQAVVVDDKGEITSDTIEDAVKQLLERKPILRPAQGNFQGSGSRTTESTTSGGNRGGGAKGTAEDRERSLSQFMPTAPTLSGSLTKKPTK